MNIDREVLAAVFIARIDAAKMSEADVTAAALEERKASILWLKSESTKDGSFRWMCDELDLEPSAVRRMIL